MACNSVILNDYEKCKMNCNSPQPHLPLTSSIQGHTGVYVFNAMCKRQQDLAGKGACS